MVVDNSTLEVGTRCPTAFFYNCVLRREAFARNAALTFGGAIHNQQSTANIFDSTISNNNALRDGGGVYNRTGAVTLRSCTVVSNTAAFFE